ncbi:MAG: NUDIX domain-containing protein [Tissierellia bacterium]|nr:NUDIX domain-containing protein [Tissierellia bacterium]
MDILQAVLGPYRPKNPQEERDLAHLKRLDPSLVGISRDRPYHYTVSSLVLDPSGGEVLFIYHRLYKSWGWPGGHLEEGETPFEASLRELYEETGLKYVRPLGQDPVGLELLPVGDHTKKGHLVRAHMHINLCYGFVGKKRDTLLANLEETKGVSWLKKDQLAYFVTEDHMLPLYEELLGRMDDLMKKER